MALHLIAELEHILRSGPQIGFVDGTLLEAVVVAGPLLVALLCDDQARILFLGIVALVALLVVARSVYAGRRGPAELLRLIWTIAVRIVLALWIAVAVGCWTFLVCRHNFYGAAASLAALTIFGLLRRRAEFVARRMLLISSTLGLLFFIGLNPTLYYSAQQIEQSPIFSESSYDAEYLQGNYFIASAQRREVVILEGEVERAVENTWLTQRMVVDPDGETVFAVNYCKRPGMCITAIGNGQTRQIPIEGCDMPVSAQFDRKTRELVVVCEHSCSVHLLDPQQGVQRHHWNVGCLPDSVAVDSVRRRAYVSAEVMTVFLTMLQLDGQRDAQRRYAGLVNWDVKVDETTGRIFVARGIQGEVAVFDSELRLLKLIRVGSGPRDMEIDQQRRLLLVGNYFSGTLSLIDIDRLELVLHGAVGKRGVAQDRFELLLPLDQLLLRKLRGVSVTSQGKWLIADITGVWEIDPDQVLPRQYDSSATEI
ncbi:MAG: hypothetical protein P9M14_17085 [Candidatus Alcyoniella australis]|nr:hypothetical protein [Candidatus Alcyoniella australis]